MLDNLGFLVLLWSVVVGIIIFRNWRVSSTNGGIVLFFVIALSMIHWFSPLIFLFPWYPYGDSDTTITGFRITVIGILSFFVAHIVFAPIINKAIKQKILNPSVPIQQAQGIDQFKNLTANYFIIGIVFFLLIGTKYGNLPTARALLSVGPNLITAAVCVACIQAIKNRKYDKLRYWILVSLSFPIVTVITRGFLGLGAEMTIRVSLLTSKFLRSKIFIIIYGTVFIYLGLSLYQGYMRDRGELRELVWGGASVVDSAAAFGNTMINFELFSIFNVEQLDRLNERLNQNYFVGLSVKQLRSDQDFAHGETIINSFKALVPRVIWPDKPIVAGGSDIVSKYTGLKFGKNTSVGVGLVMEFYINFGTTGVIIGFFIFGIILTVLDYVAGFHLSKENYSGFVIWFLIGLAFLNVGGSLTEVTATAGASFVVGYALSKYQMQSKQMRLAVPVIALLVVMNITGNALPWIYPYLKKLMLLLGVLLLIRLFILPSIKSSRSPTG